MITACVLVVQFMFFVRRLLITFKNAPDRLNHKTYNYEHHYSPVIVYNLAVLNVL